MLANKGKFDYVEVDILGERKYLVYISNDKGGVQSFSHYNIALASYVTSVARVVLYTSCINVIKQNPGAEIIYMDTDSLFFDSKDRIKEDYIYENIK
jgi:hypothetical protein